MTSRDITVVKSLALVIYVSFKHIKNIKKTLNTTYERSFQPNKETYNVSHQIMFS